MAAGPIWILTPPSTAIGFLPIRDINVCPLPDFAEHFAAQTLLARGAPGHHSARSAQDAYAQAAINPANLQRSDVAPATRLRNPADVADDRTPVRRVFQEYAQRLPRLRFVHYFIRRDKPFFFKHAGDLNFQLRSRQFHAGMPRL